MEPFCEISQWLQAIFLSEKKAPSWMVEGILIASLVKIPELHQFCFVTFSLSFEKKKKEEAR